jgi:hypothetical protein
MKRFTPAQPDTIQLDIDSADDLKIFYAALPWLSCIAHEHGFPIREMHFRTSSTRSHYHVSIRLAKRLPLMERIALQAILGSDRARELCNWERVKCRSAHPILLIEPLHISQPVARFVRRRADKNGRARKRQQKRG